jgi:hypothetical protein
MRAPMLRCGAYFMQEECSVKEKPASTEQDGTSLRAGGMQTSSRAFSSRG